jgi:hypothetical protein
MDVFGVALHGERDYDGREIRFGMETDIPDAVFQAISKALAGRKEWQLRVTAGRAYYSPNGKRYQQNKGSLSEGQFLQYEYPNSPIREYRQRIVPLVIEVIFPGDPNWVAISVKTESWEGMYTPNGGRISKQTHKAVNAACREMFERQKRGFVPAPAPAPQVPTVAPVKEPVVTPTADATAEAEAKALIEQMLGGAEVEDVDLG